MGLLIDRVSDHLDNVVKMKFTQMSLYRHCFHDKPSRPIRRLIPTGHRHCRWRARKPVRTAGGNSPQCTNSGMQVLLSRVAAQRTCRHQCAAGPPSQRGFPLPDKHLRSDPETKQVHLRHLSSHPCRELSKSREVSVDNAVNAITDSVAYKFYIFKTRHVQGHRAAPPRDPVPGRPRSGGFLAAARNGRRTAPTPCTERDSPVRASGNCNLHGFAGFGCHSTGNKEGPAPSVPPAGYFRVNDRTTRTETRYAQPPQGVAQSTGRAAASTPEHRLAPHAHVLTQRFSQ